MAAPNGERRNYRAGTRRSRPGAARAGRLGAALLVLLAPHAAGLSGPARGVAGGGSGGAARGRPAARSGSLPWQLAAERAKASLRPATAAGLSAPANAAAPAAYDPLAPQPPQSQPAADGAPAASAAAAASAADAEAEHVLCLPLFGVLCDPEPEMSLVAFAAALQLWPAQMAACAAVPAEDAGLRRHQPGLTATDKRRVAEQVRPPHLLPARTCSAPPSGPPPLRASPSSPNPS